MYFGAPMGESKYQRRVLLILVVSFNLIRIIRFFNKINLKLKFCMTTIKKVYLFVNFISFYFKYIITQSVIMKLHFNLKCIEYF